MLVSTDLRGTIAIIPTPSLDGADHWSATETVNLAETERLVHALIDDGAQGLISLGTTGECATLTESEYRSFAECVVSTVAGRVPVFVGATALGTHHVVERLRFLSDIGADGTMLGLPMWQPLTEDMAVKYYSSISEAFPDLAVMVYANPRAFRFEFPPSFWNRIVEEAPTIMSCKMGPPTYYREMLEASAGRINILPADLAVAQVATAFPESVTACWSTSASMGPQPVNAMMDALLVGDIDAMKAVDADVQWATETFMPPNREEFGFYNIQLEKIRMTASGYCDAGPLRPPYDVVPEEYAERAADSGRRWAEIATKYSKGDRT